MTETQVERWTVKERVLAGTGGGPGSRTWVIADAQGREWRQHRCGDEAAAQAICGVLNGLHEALEAMERRAVGEGLGEFEQRLALTASRIRSRLEGKA